MQEGRNQDHIMYNEKLSIELGISLMPDQESMCQAVATVTSLGE